MSKIIPKETVIPAKTEHFSFNLRRIDVQTSTVYSISSDDNTKQCLELVISKSLTSAHLSQIESFYECLAEPLNMKIFQDNSFGVELLKYMIQYIKIHHPHVNSIHLTDKSKIICNRELNDNMDLLTYNLILYGQSWYEVKGDAEIDSKSYPAYMIDKYKSSLEKLRSTTFKNDFTIQKLFRYINQYNPLALTIIDTNKIMDFFNNSKTLPEFIIKINEELNKKDKCRFYRSWLEQLVYDHVKPLLRNYMIHINHVGGRRKRFRAKLKTRRFKSSHGSKKLN